MTAAQPDGAPDPTPESAVTPSTPEPEAGATPTPEELERIATPATVRRAPRYRAFALAGALAGVLAAVVAVVLVPEPVGRDAPLGTGAVWLVLAVVGAALGSLLGTAVAVVVERSARTR